MTDEAKNVPLKINGNIIGTATIQPNGQIDTNFDPDLCRQFNVYDYFIGSCLKHLSFEPNPSLEIKEH